MLNMKKYNYSQKDTLDQFYTKPEIAKELINQLDLSKYDLIVEPSAGTGAFSNQLPPHKTLALDIDPKHPTIIKQDFLVYQHKHETPREKTLAIGNPPFGKQGSLALKFITKCSEFANTIAFILPRSFIKVSMKNKIPIYYHLHKEKLLNNCFQWKNEPYNVPVVFQVWQLSKRKRKQNMPIIPQGFQYSTKKIADFSVRRVGFYAGKASKDVKKSIQSHYFIELEYKKETNRIINYLNEHKWPGNNTTGPRSISKQELNKVLNKILKNNNEQVKNTK